MHLFFIFCAIRLLAFINMSMYCNLFILLNRGKIELEGKFFMVFCVEKDNYMYNF